jgi:receptor expression-enhancing protein 5/6
LKGPCAKIGVRPAYVALITAVIALLSIVLGIAARFLSTFISIIIPAYKSIQAIESNGILFYLLLSLN